jgi:hypothetical protein
MGLRSAQIGTPNVSVFWTPVAKQILYMSLVATKHEAEGQLSWK